ncbi:MAG: hypothetical protein UE295_12055 [Acutalibacteraceae bacterium]|nr:hypothetical protein [Acutalibacteraceae bacterium]
MGRVKFDMFGWDKLKKTLEGKYTTQVGILGSQASKEHNKTTKTNAEIGAIHELGLVAGIPQRSFLKMPLEKKLFNKISERKDDYFTALERNNLKKWFFAVGEWCEEIIDDAFETEGFGTWEKNSPITVSRKGLGKKVLFDTGQLRNSISSRVVEK